MMPTPGAGARIGGKIARGKHVLPAPIPRRAPILAFQGVRKINSSLTRLHIFLMRQSHPLQVLLQHRNDRLGQDRVPVFGAFPLQTVIYFILRLIQSQ